MDRARTSGGEHSPAVRAAGAEPCELVLAAGSGDGGEPGVHAVDRRAVPASPRVWLAADDGPSAEAWPHGEPQARAALDAADGPRGDLCQAAAVAAGRGGADLPVFAAECGDRASEPSVEPGHH